MSMEGPRSRITFFNRVLADLEHNPLTLYEATTSFIFGAFWTEVYLKCPRGQLLKSSSCVLSFLMKRASFECSVEARPDLLLGYKLLSVVGQSVSAAEREWEREGENVRGGEGRRDSWCLMELPVEDEDSELVTLILLDLKSPLWSPLEDYVDSRRCCGQQIGRAYNVTANPRNPGGE
ncbi:hypothetical protein R1sor_024133 [Riccia sorocarpa]|uniref:Uncharacterized protein n=1 Tax=Riccia sorocarpa TaxID=122646 RepID=A0ABD3GRU0_9MARC